MHFIFFCFKQVKFFHNTAEPRTQEGTLFPCQPFLFWVTTWKTLLLDLPLTVRLISEMVIFSIFNLHCENECTCSYVSRFESEP